MLAHGNGRAEKCVMNILSMARGECPYERCKGLSAELLDMPVSEAKGMLAEDISMQLSNYEPRVDNDGIMMAIQNSYEGVFSIDQEVEVLE